MNSGFKGITNPVNDIANNIYTFLLNSSLTIGDYKYSASNVEYNGWLLCNGQAVSVAEYPDLYNVIGTTFGGGEGTFNLPNFIGRIPGMPGNANTSEPLDDLHTFGDSIGTDYVILTEEQMPIHNHTGLTENRATGVTNVNNGTHNHGITDPGHNHSYFNQPNSTNPATSLTTMDVADNINVNQTTGTSTTGITINNNGLHTHTITDPTHNHVIDNDGGSLKHPNIQPTLYAGNMFIFSKYVTVFVSALTGIPLVQ